MHLRTNKWIKAQLAAATVVAAFAIASEAQAATVRVTNEAGLRSAFNAATAGTTISLADGRYVLTAPLVTPRAGTSASVIKVIAEHQGMATVETNGHPEAFNVTKKYWWFEGLLLKVTRNSTYGFKMEADGAYVRIYKNTIEIQPGSEAGIKGAGGPTAPQPDYATIDRNVIYMSAPTTYFLAEGLDAVAVKGWAVRDNTVHDIKTTQNGVAYGIMLKGNSLDAIVERNTVYGCFIGISLGGGGTGSQWMRDNDGTYESRRGIIRNNVVSDSRDVAMYIYAANGTQVFNNTTYNSYTSCGTGCSAIDVRMSGASADVRNNILDKKVQNRDGGTNTQSNNLTLPSPTSTLWFKNAAARDFSLTTAGALLAKNKATVLSGVTADVNRVARPQNGAPDIGATEQ